eukprot:14531630-Alexandrium_andersonii.AAC.1
MSASLVGSEMCIRDRNQTLPAASGGEDWPWTLPKARVYRVGHHAGHRAVSYTHLTLPTICSV